MQSMQQVNNGVEVQYLVVIEVMISQLENIVGMYYLTTENYCGSKQIAIVG